MTTEIDTYRESELSVLPPARRPAEAAIAMLESHADMMDRAYELAFKMCKTKMVPTRFQGKAEDGTAAILYGAELGLNPIQSLQRVIPIHGMPSIEARTMVALLQARGYKVKTRAQSDTSVTVWGRDLDGEEYETTWTIERATKAGYVPKPASPDSLQRPEVDEDWVTVTKTWDGKAKKSVVGNMKYILDPQAMLKAKAQSEVCREIAPEVLLGIGYTREDLESERWPDEDSRPRTVESSRGESVTVEEVVGRLDDPVKRSGLGDKIKPAPEPVDDVDEVDDVESETEPVETSGDGLAADKGGQGTAADGTPPPSPGADPEPGRGGGDDQSQGTTPSSGAELATDSGDQAAATPKAAPNKTTMRKALEKRLFALIGEIEPALDRDDRITVYRSVLERDDLTSTDDLTDVEISKVGDELYGWSQNNVLGDRILDIVNTATLSAENGQ